VRSCGYCITGIEHPNGRSQKTYENRLENL